MEGSREGGGRNKGNERVELLLGEGRKIGRTEGGEMIGEKNYPRDTNQ